MSGAAGRAAAANVRATAKAKSRMVFIGGEPPALALSLPQRMADAPKFIFDLWSFIMIVKRLRGPRVNRRPLRRLVEFAGKSSRGRSGPHHINRGPNGERLRSFPGEAYL